MRVLVGPPPEGVTLPVWTWARRQGVNGRRPDMRRVEYGDYGDTIDLLELDVSKSRLLLTDANGWDCVLANTFYCPEIQSDGAFYAKCAYLEGLPEEQRTKIIRNTWDAILDVNSVYPEDKWWGRGMNIQATMWEIRKEDVVSVTTHINRKRKSDR
jgi:hypothetical protein